MALPLDIEHWRERADGMPRDLALRSPEKSEVVFKNAAWAIEASATAGVQRIELALTSERLPHLFHGSDVVILLAHAPREGAVELEDGVLDCAGFVALMPAFSGCLDLAVCFSEPLANAIRFATGCVVAGRADEALLGRWVKLYRHTLLGVLEQGRPYADVITDILLV